MSSVLVTGFEPFAGLPANTSALILERLPRQIAGRSVETRVLPVDSEAVRPLGAELCRQSHEAVVHLGLARDRGVITIERLGLNVLDFEGADNAGRVVRGAAVIEGAPLALAARLPLDAIVDAWRAEHIDGRVSNSAGTYLCNQVLYQSLHALDAETPVGFLHVPPDEELAAAFGTGVRGRPLEELVRAVAIALEVTLRERRP